MDGPHSRSPYLNSGSDPSRQFKSMGLEAPRIFGKNPSAWISQMQRYFDYYITPDQRRLIIASFYLDGDALYWYDWMQKYHLLSSWNEFCWQLINGLICQIVMRLLSKTLI